MSTTGRSLKQNMFPNGILWGLCLLIAVMTVGCAGTYGGIRWDEEVTQFFETHQVQPDYQYFTYHVGMRVFAIVGLDKELEMQTGVWRELASDTEDFKVAVSRIWYNDYQSPSDPQGAVIMDPDGERVGIYFSSLSLPSIKFMPENQVMIMLDTTVIRGDWDLRRVP